ncbi:DUF6602 domain-containing protein [Clostridium felsineum]|uniref:DUF6602 domain-containing protein n=1 Tax=Clostridium felsineum TaxID=36839 RepID=UPI0009C527C8|nr:DUF6602 domain-containing protein [Clostridium felsineum]URZ15118.1 hypothetical protein CLFE_011360 [Clostridium felsineum DSM 794]
MIGLRLVKEENKIIHFILNFNEDYKYKRKIKGKGENANMDKEETLKKLYENYKNIEKCVVDQLFLDTPNHQLTAGTYREEVWKDLFEKIIPKKFCIDQGVFIIDSNGNISDEVDLAIFDEQYTPYIFNYGKIKFIPIEAVAVVIQCKSVELKTKDLGEWIKSIDKLTTSLNSIVRVMPGLVDNNIENEKNTKSQTSTRPIRILCCIGRNGEIKEAAINMFDICLCVNKDKNSLKKVIKNESDTYYQWYESLNHYKVERFGNNMQLYQDKKNTKGKDIKTSLLSIKIVDNNENENVILSLIFQLNQLLMLINNPMLFPHESYATLFNNIGKKFD